MTICVIEIKKDFAISVYAFLHPSQTVGGSVVFSCLAWFERSVFRLAGQVQR